MILTTNTTIAIQCPQCGELEFHALSLFAFSQQGRKNLRCGCGLQLVSVASRNRQQFNISYACAYCGQTHYLRLNRRAIWGKEALPLTCPAVESSVGYIGPKQKVTQACHEREKSIGELAVELGYQEEFENPEVMLRILDHLHALAKQGDLGCACGNHQLSFELLPDRIELYCDCCEAVGVIYADSTDNVRQVEGINSMYLEENKTWRINSPLRGQPLAKTNKEEEKWR
ncbi:MULTISPECIES: hypothetical protein [Desulfosporosinus]|uniref:Uncharacterized protein n=1 Tax=Desulfosporosinus acididurans TaxID=476652 RepID=A0A0J1FVS0_9FIRM|nr:MULTISPECIES: hypothetical protein [Desulfosporosinus]KLU67078.1 hypothetical protein DEAC_c10120 [Desulfosporosinus acididurans]